MTRMRPSMLSLRSVGFAVLAALVSTPLIVDSAVAQDGASETNEAEPRQFYVEYMVGVSHSPEDDLDVTSGLGANFTGDLTPEPVGYFFGAAAGATVIPNVRAELQIGFRRNELDTIEVRGEADGARDSTVSLFSVMYNGYYDFDFRDQGVPVRPWIGAGIGWGMPRLDAQNDDDTLQLAVDDTDSTFIWNVMGGITWPMTEIAELVAGYRYISSLDYHVSGTSGGTPVRLEHRFTAHEGYTGIRFRF